MPSRAHMAQPNVSISTRTRLGVHARVPRKARCNPPSRALRFLLADDQVNDAGWIENEKAVKIFPQLLDFMHHNRDLAGQIVFEFDQASVLSARASEEANLRYLSGLGFRLSMDQVKKLDLDFAKLKRLGFSFLKVRAETLISGMKSAQAAVAAEDLKDLLARNGINLIAERIEEEKSVVQLLDFQVDFGQGYLFGEPRPIRDMAEAHDPRAKDTANVQILSSGLVRRLAG